MTTATTIHEQQIHAELSQALTHVHNATRHSAGIQDVTKMVDVQGQVIKIGKSLNKLMSHVIAGHAPSGNGGAFHQTPGNGEIPE